MATEAIDLEGRSAPLFTLKDHAGNPHVLKDLRGRHVVLYFYPKDDTPGCTKEACAFRDLRSDFAKHDALILGVSPDGPDAHAAFVRKYQLPFTLLCDPDRKVMTKYGAYGEKIMYGRKTTGVIRSTVWIDPNGKVVKHWRKVAKAADHPQKVLDLIAEGVS